MWHVHSRKWAQKNKHGKQFSGHCSLCGQDGVIGNSEMGKGTLKRGVCGGEMGMWEGCCEGADDSQALALNNGWLVYEFP